MTFDGCMTPNTNNVCPPITLTAAPYTFAFTSAASLVACRPPLPSGQACVAGNGLSQYTTYGPVNDEKFIISVNNAGATVGCARSSCPPSSSLIPVFTRTSSTTRASCIPASSSCPGSSPFPFYATNPAGATLPSTRQACVGGQLTSCPTTNFPAPSGKIYSAGTFTGSALTGCVEAAARCPAEAPFPYFSGYGALVMCGSALTSCPSSAATAPFPSAPAGTIPLFKTCSVPVTSAGNVLVACADSLATKCLSSPGSPSSAYPNSFTLTSVAATDTTIQRCSEKLDACTIVAGAVAAGVPYTTDIRSTGGTTLLGCANVACSTGQVQGLDNDRNIVSCVTIVTGTPPVLPSCPNSNPVELYSTTGCIQGCATLGSSNCPTTAIGSKLNYPVLAFTGTGAGALAACTAPLTPISSSSCSAATGTAATIPVFNAALNTIDQCLATAT